MEENETTALQGAVEAVVLDGHVTFERPITMSWGMLMPVSIEQVSEDAGGIFVETVSAESRSMGVDADFIDQNLVLIDIRGDDGSRRYAQGWHTMPENSDESYSAYFHGHVALPRPGCEEQARAEMLRRHHELLVKAVNEQIERVVEAMRGVSPQEMKAFQQGRPLRRLLRLMAGSA